MVDDEPALAEMAAVMLRRTADAVLTARSGEEALAVLEREPCDLVISDIGMGDGMNGWELAERIRGSWPRTAVALVTGWGGNVTADAVASHGLVGVLAKPYRIAELVRLVESALGPRV